MDYESQMALDLIALLMRQRDAALQRDQARRIARALYAVYKQSVENAEFAGPEFEEDRRLIASARRVLREEKQA